MDIFTTQLTRVVPNRLKPAKLKVKGLAKEARSQNIDQEHDHLDEHDKTTATYQRAHEQFSPHGEINPDAEQGENDQQAGNQQQLADKAKDEKSQDDNKDDEPPIKHFDLFV